MKRIIFSIAVLLSFITGFSQVNDVRAKRVIVDQSLFIGVSSTYGRWVDTIYNDTTNMNGYARSIPTNNAVYDFVAGRHTGLNTAINLRLLKSDTAAMLSVYTRRKELQDTAAAIRASGGVTNGDKNDVTVSGSGITWTIDNDVVTYAKMQNVSATNRIMGRVSSGAGDMEELTPTQVTSMLNIFTSSLNGLAPASGGGTTNYLRADGTWAEPAGGGGGGGEANIGSNLGGGLSNYDSKTGVTLQFNTFYSSDFDLASNLFKIDYANGQEVSHSVDGFATATQATRWDSVTYFRNTGPTGEGILIEIDDGLLGFKKLIAGTGIDFDVADSSITINGGGGGGRFGVDGEDDTAAEERIFNATGHTFTLFTDNNDIVIRNEDAGVFTNTIGMTGNGYSYIRSEYPSFGTAQVSTPFGKVHLYSSGQQFQIDSLADVSGFPDDMYVVVQHEPSKFLYRASYADMVGGSAARGTATLSGGTITVNTASALTGSKIFVTRNTPGGTLGNLSVPSASIVNATSFVINSSSGSETSTVNWYILN